MPLCYFSTESRQCAGPMRCTGLRGEQSDAVRLPAATVAASGSLALDHTGNKQRKSLEVHFHTINIKNGI